MAELPKVEPTVGSAFLFYKLKNNSIGERKLKYFKELPWWINIIVEIKPQPDFGNQSGGKNDDKPTP
jgi:hypothetical protein